MPAGRHFFSWTFPGAPIRIEFALKTVERLKREVRRAGSEEIAGFLLGSATAGTPRVVEIADSKSVPRSGGVRAFTNGASELGGRLAGYYRSRHGKGVCLDEEDVSIIRACLRDSCSVFLVMHPEPHGDITAGFFFWDDGHINTGFSFLEFPLDAAELPAVRRDPKPESQRSARWRRAALVAAAALVCLVPFVATVVPKQPPPSPSAPALGLRAVFRGPDLVLTWNNSADALTPSSRGVLWIRDGEQEQSMALATEQLRAGRILYTPRSSKIRFRLQVLGGDREAIAENVLVLAPARSGGQP
jgi:hypothetical protein